MESGLRTAEASSAEIISAASWGSIAAGAVTASAVSLALVALGVGLGLSAVSPWTDTGVSASTFKVTAGVYLVLVAVMSSAIGGYLSARLRTKWVGIHTNEAFFRDTAHGFVAWAFATIISATVLGTAITHLVGGAASATASAGQSAANANPAQVYVDRLFRRESPAGSNAPASGTAPGSDAGTVSGPQSPAAGTSAGPNPATRAEVTRLWSASIQADEGLAAADRAYIARLVATNAGLNQADAEKRVDEVVQQAKADADRLRRNGAQFAFWMTAALLFGAFAASLAAAEGGQHRDGTWDDRRLTPRAW
ncbi:MAG: hypothetical protein WAK04_17580 [Xanthobacteraceae bacterium]